MADSFDYSHGAQGDEPTGPLDFQTGDPIPPEHFDWWWYTVIQSINNHAAILEALDILQFTQKRAAPIISKVIESALRNVEESDDLNWEIDDLKVEEIYANEGPTLKRFKPRAMGRATTILKRTSHIHVALAPNSSD